MAARDNPYYIQPPSIYEALMAGVGGYDKASETARQNANDEIMRQVGQQVAQGGITDSALGQLFGMSRSAGVPALNAAAHLQAAKMQGQKVFGNPIWGVGPDGKPAVGTYDQSGNFRRIDTGGFQPNPGIKVITTPQGDYVVDSKGGQTIGGGQQPGQPGVPGQAPGYYPKDYTSPEVQKGAAEKANTMGKAKGSLDTSFLNLDQVVKQTDELLSDPKLGRVTGWKSYVPSAPSDLGGARDTDTKLERLKNQAAIGALTAMREASKTGGAVGQVTEREYPILQSMFGNLNAAQSETEFRKSAQALKDYVGGLKQNLQKAYDTDYGNLQRPDTSIQPGAGAAPPVRGARQAPNGKWYIQNPNTKRWFEVQP